VRFSPQRIILYHTSLQIAIGFLNFFATLANFLSRHPKSCQRRRLSVSAVPPRDLDQKRAAHKDHCRRDDIFQIRRVRRPRKQKILLSRLQIGCQNRQCVHDHKRHRDAQKHLGRWARLSFMYSLHFLPPFVHVSILSQPRAPVKEQFLPFWGSRGLQKTFRQNFL